MHLVTILSNLSYFTIGIIFYFINVFDFLVITLLRTMYSDLHKNVNKQNIII